MNFDAVFYRHSIASLLLEAIVEEKGKHFEARRIYDNDLSGKHMHEYYSIGELTREFGVTTRTLRYYEDQGLIVPMRRGRTRLYTELDRHRLQQIFRAKRLNFSLAEIASLLTVTNAPLDDAIEVENVLQEIKEKREDLRQMRRDIDDSLHELERIEEICFERLAERDVNR